MAFRINEKIEGVEVSEFISWKGIFEFALLKGVDLGGTMVDLEYTTLKEFFKEFTTDDLCELYIIRIQDDLAKESLKEIIMERLDLPDDEAFELWLKLQ